jgi:hypothetical protein
MELAPYKCQHLDKQRCHCLKRETEKGQSLGSVVSGVMSNLSHLYIDWPTTAQMTDTQWCGQPRSTLTLPDPILHRNQILSKIIKDYLKNPSLSFKPWNG